MLIIYRFVIPSYGPFFMENLFFIMVDARQYKMTKQEDAVLKAPKILLEEISAHV